MVYEVLLSEPGAVGDRRCCWLLSGRPRKCAASLSWSQEPQQSLSIISRTKAIDSPENPRPGRDINENRERNEYAWRGSCPI